MASFNIHVDKENQENAAPFGAVGSRRVAKGFVEGGQKVPFGQARSVLGQLSTNTFIGNSKRTQPTRAAKQAGGFSIFCDENSENGCAPAPAKLPALGLQRQTASSRLPLVDKPINLPVPVQPSNAAAKEFAAPMEAEDSNTSNEVEDESPMLLDTSHQEWRVPPISAQPGEAVDILAVPEYAKDIYTYLRSTESKFLPKWNYMSKQPDITHSMRAILVDWLVEVAEEYKLQTETLYLAISYIDRFLSFMSVQRAKLQLVGTACMFIAAKYEEIYPPDVTEFVYITDDTYNKRQVLRMEHLVLKVLNFELSTPSSHLFVSQIADMGGCSERTKHLAMYLNELSLMHGDKFMVYAPSLVAACSVALARHTEGLEAWPNHLAESALYSVDQLQECLLALHATHTSAEGSPQQSIREKYKSSKYGHVAEITPAVLSK